MTRVWDVEVGDATRVPEAARAAGEAARGLGLDGARTDAAVLTASELATNMCRYAGGGRFVAEAAQEPWGRARALQILTLDHGPGIPDVPRAMEDGFSTADSLGTGLGACARAADFFELQSSPGRGTVAVARFARPEDRSHFGAQASTGGVHVPLSGHRRSGDALAFRSGAGRRTVMLADGLGHGDAAAEASTLATRFVLHGGGGTPEALLRGLHEALRRTRGAAVAIAEIDEPRHRLTFCGVGNVGARLYRGGRWETLLSRPGIVGAFGLRTPLPTRYEWLPGDMLVLHSDGLPSRWTPAGIERLRDRDAAVVAGAVFRDSGSAARLMRDDTSIAVATHTVRTDREGR
ncbi:MULTISPECIES: SpoIIE family protein phosphatase [Nocardiopsis]|uniref:Serine/threonine protein kinase n=1 Tax=Nocardiopsis sinuspersici TaxID=501010 RepID=A0A1V3C431_9ACTN|nr:MULTISPECIES: SpoIIE family protein phosphatase [Nocardiopsis]OOC55402.1 serine/threonine protein kinase [Nocardiopsis sinuspersici]